MNLPQELQHAIAAEVGQFRRSSIVRASAELSRRYKSAAKGVGIKDEALRAAYLAVRMPATFAAVSRALAEIRRLTPQIDVSSLLDLGSGPGTALWAAAQVFPDLGTATLMESDAAWIQTGRRMAAQSFHATICQSKWILNDLCSAPDLPAHDLVVISYVLGELPTLSGEAVLQKALRAARKYLVIVEPGTMRGFEVIHRARGGLIASDVGILAPCPHRKACPMAAAGDWCHFSQRLGRSSLHRQIKGGELAYEDEKFSYIIADKFSSAIRGTRIVRHPQKHSGHIELTLCAPEGIEHETITRSDKSRYKLARQAEWGELWTA